MENSKSNISNELKKEILSTPSDPAPLKSTEFTKKNLKSFYKENNKRKGILKISHESQLPITYKIYLRSLSHITQTMLIYTLLTAIPIYTIAIFNINSAYKDSNFFTKIFDFILLPNAFISKSSFYEFFEHTLSPLSLLLVVGILSYRLARVKQSFLDKEEYSNNFENFNFLKNFQLKKIKFERDKDMNLFLYKFLDMEVEKKAYIYYDPMEIQDKWFELEEFNFKISELMEKNEQVTPEILKEYEEKKRDLRVRLNNMEGDRGIFISNLNIVMFKSYRDSENFLKEIKKWKKDEGKNDERARNLDIIDYVIPYDIKWSHFGKISSFFSKTQEVIFFIFMILFVPCITFFIQYSFHLTIAPIFFDPEGTVRTGESKAKVIIYERRYFFLIFRLLVTLLYNFVLSYYIEKFFNERDFRTGFILQKTKFYFMNFFCLSNSILADFYSILMTGIENNKTGDESVNKKQLDVNSSFLYMTCLKVVISLITSPYILKFVQVYLPILIPKIKGKFSKSYKLLDSEEMKIENDTSVHDIGTTASFIVHCVYFLSFIYSFMMPFINILVVIGMFLFLKFERYTILNKHLLPSFINIEAVLMIYKNVILGFLLIKFFSLGNSKLVVNYMSDANFSNLAHLVSSIFDYTSTLLVLIGAIIIIRRYKFEKITKSLRNKFKLIEEKEYKRYVEDMRFSDKEREVFGINDVMDNKMNYRRDFFQNDTLEVFELNYPLNRYLNNEFDLEKLI